MKAKTTAQRVVTLIRDRRKQMKISQEQMAIKLGVSSNTYQRMEYGNMTLDELEEVGRILSTALILVPHEYAP